MSEQVFIRVAHNFIDLTGKRFGRLVVERYTGSVGKKSKWQCVCDCGNRTIVNGQSLTRLATRSCGCLFREIVGARFKSHGKRYTPEYNTWCGMRQRCLNPNTTRWADYGGRGIKVCDRWMHDFPAFLADVGQRPSPRHSLNRVNNDGDYEPGNVRWALASEQMRNRRPFKIPKNVKTHCPSGHEYSVENTYLWNGTKRCLRCKRAQGLKTKLKRKAYDEKSI